jgi:hypothetical protein
MGENGQGNEFLLLRLLLLEITMDNITKNLFLDPKLKSFAYESLRQVAGNNSSVWIECEHNPNWWVLSLKM